MIKNIPSLLIVDDEKNAREGLRKALRLNFHVEVSDNAWDALKILDEKKIDIILTDVKMPKMDGITFVKKVIEKNLQITCFVMTAYGSIERAVEAMKAGAKDFITKPFDIDDLEQRLQMSTIRPKDVKTDVKIAPISTDIKLEIPIIGESDELKTTLEIMNKVAPTKVTVLLTGESGTGKEIFARAIHQLSPRAKKPFIAVHCQSLNENLIESELFGHEKGSFTNANSRHVGRFELANDGTLFLDEIGDIDLSTQIKLLRVLETRTFQRLGGQESINVDVRLITATNKNLWSMVEDGTFREDLYYRLDVFNLHLPPLRERVKDIPLLAQHFLDNSDFSVEKFSPQAIKRLKNYSWRGNIRELKNVIEQACILCLGKTIEVEHLSKLNFEVQNNLIRNSNKNEKETILQALKQSRYNKTRAAEILGINRRTLHRKLKQFAIEGDLDD